MTHDDTLAIQGWLLALAPYFMAAVTAWLTLRNHATIKETKVAVQEGTAVSTRNETALTTVQLKQDTNKTAIIEGVKHELNNGSGDVIAAKTAAHITPVIEAMAQTIPVDTAKIAEGVAAALVEAKLTPYEGDDRRVSGVADRRQSKEIP